MAQYTYDEPTNREDLTDVITNISPKETPITTMIGKTKAKATYHEFPEDELADDWDEQAYRRICAIQADGTELLSFEQSHKASQGEYNSILYVLLGIMLIYLVYVALFCYFVSNAEKYPRIVRWLFVKEDWLA